MRYILFFAVCAALFTSCNNLEDAKPADRNTFVKSLEGPYDLRAASLELIPGGFVILANETVIKVDTSYIQTVLIEVTEKGDRVGEFHPFTGGTGKSFKPLFDDGLVTGYIIVGDSIYIDPLAQQAANVSIASMRILIVNNNFSRSKSLFISDKEPITDVNGGHPVKTDFFGGAVNTSSDDRIILLGTYKEGLINQAAAPEKQLLFSLDADRDSAWFKTYDLLGNTYTNAKSVHFSYENTVESIIWATAIADVQGDFTSSYLAIPKVSEDARFDNFDPFGQNSTQLFLPRDIQKAKSEEFGFGVIGTYSETTDGAKSNIFFLRVNIAGKVIPDSERYFDAIESFKKDSADVHKNISSIIDEGEAIAATKDGFVLAGSFTTIPAKGKGGKDIFLVKVDDLGNMLWAKTFGGSGDETVSVVRETDDGGLIICGTNTLGGYSSIFLIRTDKNGELKN
jgi:hypothetical protein